MADQAAGGQRIDKWLWFARIAKSRTLAAALVTGGKVRLNRVKTDKPAHLVRAGDVLTVSLGPRVRILKVLAQAERRGPAAEARGLFEELTPAPVHLKPAPGTTLAGPVAGYEPSEGRPDKRDRREIARLKGKIS